MLITPLSIYVCFKCMCICVCMYLCVYIYNVCIYIYIYTLKYKDKSQLMKHLLQERLNLLCCMYKNQTVLSFVQVHILGSSPSFQCSLSILWVLVSLVLHDSYQSRSLSSLSNIWMFRWVYMTYGVLLYRDSFEFTRQHFCCPFRMIIFPH